jgi:hypothetical protein
MTVTPADAEIGGFVCSNAVIVTVNGKLCGFAGTGALYIPDALIVPIVEFPPKMLFTSHVTLAVEFCTVAENCSGCPSITFAVLGEMLTVGIGATMLRLVLPDTAELLNSSAVIITIGGFGICAGAA